ncbi:dienelactone hydrolase family protein [Skermania sp. ID1734]|uniref:dienelactone hydrolase family protein n=1 Tax=Skermania sp. ID1734 TaxID=2597516 RepID=UPI00117F79D3|nr:dienelactone hydrolase family protein [Skermania sp. ID1734]TSD93649.1 dienelactone hydrolase family protein [Skermania sp. ID1734]
MTFRRYIAEEIAVDHADGLLTRREALRRLGLLGLGAAAASSLLAACSSGGGSTAASSTSTGTAASAGTAASSSAAPPGLAGAKPTEAITFAGPQGQLQAAWAGANHPRGAVLVIHENKGLTDHIRSVAGRFAGAGYSALAIDLLSQEGGTATFSDPAQATAALSKVPPERFVADMKAGLTELQRRSPNAKLGTTGFCMGGGLVWLLLASGEPRLAAATPFYGPLPANPDFSGSKAAVLAIYAALDSRVDATRDAAAAALAKAGLVHEIVTEPDADHAFFNDTGARYNQAAADDAWKRVIAWYGKYLA